MEPVQLELPIPMPPSVKPCDYAHFISVNHGITQWVVSHSWLAMTRYGQRRMYAKRHFKSKDKAEKYAQALRDALDKQAKREKMNGIF